MERAVPMGIMAYEVYGRPLKAILSMNEFVCVPLHRDARSHVTSCTVAEAAGAHWADAYGGLWLREGPCSRERVGRQGSPEGLQNGRSLL